MDEHDALLTIVNWFRKGSPKTYSNYGYDVYLPNVIRWYLVEQDPTLQARQSELENRWLPLFPPFANAAWDLCRRGILRPGVTDYEAQSTSEGSAGSGFSITSFGRQWLSENGDTFVPTEPERFAQLLKPFISRFGEGFHERAQEAVRCYGAHAYLACCAMCGAAAESVLLAVAIKKEGDEHSVLKTYVTANGRVKLENMITGKAAEHIKREFKGYTELLKYWRDEASHGKPSNISDNEAYTSLAILLRYAAFIDSEWGSLTGSDT
jgi:hypothetical protein